ncbi:hypothetical protein PsorP6_006911 [Peronosclerospora sorghi]|uniref:Uncharacterized protein n=1 Tax=Peronosclerospora sorghi TaxID=230839 RepID=A0ACC0W9S1_9STRA|nr:hypothetical protein PsorP6_006911 [Peronosclerospora sorghi]
MKAKFRQHSKHCVKHLSFHLPIFSIGYQWCSFSQPFVPERGHVVLPLKGDREVIVDDANFVVNMRHQGLIDEQETFDVNRKHERAGTPIVIPPQNTFRLNATLFKLGLLRFLELEEIFQDSKWVSVSDLIWVWPENATAKDVEMELRTGFFGHPTGDDIQRVTKANVLPEESTLNMSEILNDVVSGQDVLVCNAERTTISGTFDEVRDIG